MALAILRQTEPRNNQVGLVVETGSNRYFRLMIGTRETVKEDGIRRMETPVKQTPIMGPLPEDALGRTEVPVPNRWFDSKNRFVQLVTYKDEKGKGPAWSEIIPVIGFTDMSGDDLLPISLPTVTAMSIPQTQNKAFGYKELPLSRQQSLVDLLKEALPELLGQAGQAMAQIAVKNPQAKEATKVTSELVQSDQVRNLLALLLESIMPGQQSAAKSLSLAYTSQPYARQMAIPIPIIDALLKAVPALAPVLQSAVQGLTDPKFIDAIGRNSPVNKVLEQGHDILRDVLGLDIDVNTSVEDMTKFGADTNSLLAAMLRQNATSNGMSKGLTLNAPAVNLAKASNHELAKAGIDFLPVPQVLLSLDLENRDAKLADLASLYFAWGKTIRLPLTISTPKPIEKAWLFAGIRAVNGKTWIIRKKFRVQNIRNGQLPVEAQITAEELQGIQPNQEYTLSMRLLWPNKRGQRVGSVATRIVKFVAPLTYDQVRESGLPAIPLNDIAKYRDFWHKVWGKGLEKNFREIDLDCKYYITMSTGTGSNHRLETLTQFEADRTGKQQGKLKSGMEWGLESLSALLPLISDKPQLNAAEIAALQNEGFAHRFTQVARAKVDFWGLEGESVALWTYPEVKLHEVVLKTPLSVDENGVVQAMGERIVHVPIPSNIHFIGAKI